MEIANSEAMNYGKAISQARETEILSYASGVCAVEQPKHASNVDSCADRWGIQRMYSPLDLAFFICDLK
jgi:hypothetical protein